jgi:NAD-dependent deacetylase
MSRNQKKKRLREPIIALTGSGISAESGIPTFRGEGGLWKEYKAVDLATPKAFNQDPTLVWEFYDWRRQIISSSEPNPAHQVLNKVEQATPDFHIITQNVDGLHSQAGNTSIVELHGSIWTLICMSCGRKWKDRQAPLPVLPPHCPSCNGLARPGVVWFGEMLDHAVLELAEKIVRDAGTVLVIGTSAVVQPANLLPIIAQEAGAYVIEFNLEPTPLSPYVDECHYGPAGITLPLWWKDF